MTNQDYVCWSRMQTEAGQPLERIVARKEAERQAGDGLFCWGVGNAPSRLASTLARLGSPVRAVFSVMKSKPKDIDVTPGRVVAWRRYVDSDGAVRALPANVIVTSRADSTTGPKRHHAALMCRSDNPLALAPDAAPFDPDAFVNVGDKGGSVGASQVTALLRRVAEDGSGSAYRSDIVADLTGSYWVKLLDPVVLTTARITALAMAEAPDADDWLELAEWIRQEDRERSPRPFALEHTTL